MNESRARSGVIELPDQAGIFFRIGGRVFLMVATTVLLIGTARDALPQDPNGGPLVEDLLFTIQYALLAMSAVGVLVSLWSRGGGLVLVVLGSVFLTVISALHYEQPFPIFVGTALLVPLVMMGLDWQITAPRRRIAAGAITMAVVLAGVGIASAQVHDYFRGPTHPQSDAPDLENSPVRWIWAGAVDARGFTVTAVLREPSPNVQLLVTDRTETVARLGPVALQDADEPVRFVVDGLEPGTEYRYTLASDGTTDELMSGSVRTFPDGPGSLTIAIGACARTHSNGAVFDAIRDVDPDIYLMMGDMHYRDIVDDDPRQFASAYNQMHASPARSLLYRSTPIAYVWDDHDYGANDSDSRSASRPAAWAGYRDFVPHYDLPTGSDGSIQQAFTVGRVRVVMIDSRSHRLASAGTMLGEDQLDWLLHELLAARDTHALTLLVTPTAWIGPARAGADHWGAFADERERIGEFLVANAIENLVVLAGDAHMVAIDDGTNSGYGGHPGFPVLQAAALDRRGSVKGGPYSHGTFPGGGQFGVVEVTDDGGDRVEVELIGRDWEGTVLARLATSFAVT